MLEVRIAEKEAFTVVGRSRKINTDTAYDEVPRFWQEHHARGASQDIKGMFGICLDIDAKVFEYLIADNYLPWNEIPSGCVSKVIPAGSWAVFACRGALPNSLQETSTRIWSEWLPNSKEYKLRGNSYIELYAPPAARPEDTYCEIWIPVEAV